MNGKRYSEFDKCSSNSSSRCGCREACQRNLDGLPLALATAGAYLKQAAICFSDYLRLYEESWAKLQKTSPELSSYEDRTLYSTWQISFEHVERRNVTLGSASSTMGIL